MKDKSELLGIHLRIEKSFSQILEETIKLGLNSCQFFFMPHVLDKYVRLTQTDRDHFFEIRKNISHIFVHSSYWVNMATGNPVSEASSRKMLEKEIVLAKKLGLNHIVVHAGSAKKFPYKNDDPVSRDRGIKAVAKMINFILKKEDTITILVENTAHGGKTICSDLHDFTLLKPLLEKPEQVKFCLDTAHAYSYGYDIEKTEEFINILDQTMGLENIKLIHLNDSAKPCGSKIDQHALPGKGLIGIMALKRLINHPKLSNVPLIIEPPAYSFEELLKRKDFFKQLKEEIATSSHHAL